MTDYEVCSEHKALIVSMRQIQKDVSKLKNRVGWLIIAVSLLAGAIGGKDIVKEFAKTAAASPAVVSQK